MQIEENKCEYCNMSKTTRYGTRGASLGGGGMIYSFIANGNILTSVCGSNCKGNKINCCPMCGRELKGTD